MSIKNWKKNYFGQAACELLVLWPGIKLTSPALVIQVPTTGSPGKSAQIEIVQGKHHSDLICASFYLQPPLVLKLNYVYLNPLQISVSYCLSQKENK